MAAAAALDTMTADLALLRQELQVVLETLMRLDNQTAQLEQRLIALRDENQDSAAQLRDMRRELAAGNRLQNTLGARLARLEAPTPSEQPAR